MVKILALLATMPFAAGVATDPVAEPTGEVVFAFQDPEIIESSGLVARDGLFATLNDSGDSSRVFTVDPATGETVGVTEWDAEPLDLEAMAPAAPGEVLVGDIGDNAGQRDSISVTRLPVGVGRPTGPVTTYELVYPDKRHDAETLLVHPDTGQVMVVAKEIIGRLYAAPEELSEERPNRLREVGEVLPVATDGAFFPDGDHFLLRGYTSAAVYEWPSLEEVGEFDLPRQRQGEGVAVDERGRVFLSSEGQFTEVLEVRLPRPVQAAVDAEVETPAPPDASPGGDTGETAGADKADGEQDEPADDWPWGWLIGGVTGAIVILVLLLALRPR